MYSSPSYKEEWIVFLYWAWVVAIDEVVIDFPVWFSSTYLYEIDPKLFYKLLEREFRSFGHGVLENIWLYFL